MPAIEFQGSQSDGTGGQPAIHCDACRSALRSEGRQAIAFLLLDRLKIPLVSCDDHLNQFASICGLTTEETVDLLHHRPAGGICCPGCRLAPYNSSQPVIPIRDGAIVAMACPDHQAEIMQRFHSGLQTQHQLTASLDATTGSPL